MIFLSDFALDRMAGPHLHHQIYDFIRRAILGQRLKPGAKLPSTRWLAARLRVSRNTVLRAYEALLLDGLLVAKVGSGTHVAGGHRKFPLIRIPDMRTLLNESHYPAGALAFRDPDGHSIYIHR